MSDHHNHSMRDALMAQTLQQRKSDRLSRENLSLPTTDQKMDGHHTVVDLRNPELELVGGAIGPYDDLIVAGEEEMKHSSLRDKMAVHYEKYKQPYQKSAAASIIGAVGGVLAAEGIHK